MKRLLVFAIAATCVVAATLSIASVATSVNLLHDTVKGNGKVVSQDRTVGNFTELELHALGDVHIQQGSANAVKVETDENAQAYVITETVGDRLVIKVKKDVSLKTTKLNIQVTVAKLEGIHANGIGDIKVSGLQCDILKVNINGIGNFRMDVKARELKGKFNGTGDIMISANTNLLELNNSGVGDLTLNGEATNAKIMNHGSGDIKAEALKTDKMDIECSGVGDATVYAEKELYVKLSGMGDFRYKGNAEIKEKNVTAMGRFSKMK